MNAVLLATLLFADDPQVEVRRRMVAEQMEARGVRSAAVLEVMRSVPRHEFVPWAMRALAYSDRALPIGHGATISQPYIVAWMTELLETARGHKVLEIGTGSGYQAAVLSRLVKQVFSIELEQVLADSARERLRRMGYANVTVRCGDG